MSATFVSHAAALAAAARDLSPNAPGVAEILMLAAGAKGPWQAWAGDLVDRHPSGADGHSPLVLAWMAFDQATDRRGAARAAQRLVLPAQAQGASRV